MGGGVLECGGGRGGGGEDECGERERGVCVSFRYCLLQLMELQMYNNREIIKMKKKRKKIEKNLKLIFCVSTKESQ